MFQDHLQRGAICPNSEKRKCSFSGLKTTKLYIKDTNNDIINSEAVFKPSMAYGPKNAMKIFLHGYCLDRGTTLVYRDWDTGYD